MFGFAAHRCMFSLSEVDDSQPPVFLQQGHPLWNFGFRLTFPAHCHYMDKISCIQMMITIAALGDHYNGLRRIKQYAIPPIIKRL